MNEQFTNEMNEMDALLSQTAGNTHPNEQFVAELEQELRKKHKPRMNWKLPFKRVMPTLGWVAAMIALAFFLNSVFASLIPPKQPGTNTTPGFICPVTQPNGSQPPNESTVDANYLGNGQLWTVLWPDGRVYMTPEHQRPDGSFDMKWSWWRINPGEKLTIEGHRLDAQAEPLQADIPDGYDGNFQVSSLIFPTTGCWEVTGHVGDASLTFVTEVIFDAATPTLIATVVNNTGTPVAPDIIDQNSYNFRDAKLILNAPLPESPTQANIYQPIKDQQISLEEARALAERFGIQGEPYTAAGLIYGATDYFFTDGKQSLQIHSLRYFSYTADTTKTFNHFVLNNSADATATINTFLQSRGFDFQTKIVASTSFGGYIVHPLTPDGLPVEFEPFIIPIMLVTLDDSGNVLSLNANLVNLDAQLVGAYGIISAQEALELLINESIRAGKIEFFHSAGSTTTREWHRQYPNDQTITIYGYAFSTPAQEFGKPPFIQIDGFTATGNTDGIEALPRNTFIEALGKFITVNDITVFEVDSWNKSPFSQDGLVGTLHRDNNQLVLTTDSEELIIEPDVPADVPLPFENIFIVGVRKDNTYEWSFMDDRMTNINKGRGGGGGGGGVFYQLNLSGTPMPFSSPTAIPTINTTTGQYKVKAGDTLTSIANQFGVSVDELITVNNLTPEGLIYVDQMLVIPGWQQPADQQVQDLRGFLGITIYKHADGSQTKEYNLFVFQNKDYIPYILQGSNLGGLDTYNGLPILVSGTIHYGGAETLTVDSYKIPFPDLKFQILQGVQKSEQVNGNTVNIFTTQDGKSYVEFMANTDQPTNGFIGIQGDTIQQEVLIVPDETFGEMPVIHVFQSSIIEANSPEMQVQANKIRTYDDRQVSNPSNSTPPNLIIDSVELIYFVSNPYYQINDPNYAERPAQIQPVWHFHGHYANGDEYDVIVQALKQEYLSPKLAPAISPG